MKRRQSWLISIKKWESGEGRTSSELCKYGLHRFTERVTCETELISPDSKKVPLEVGGMLYNKTTKEKLGKANKILVYSFWIYNKTGGLIKRSKTKEKEYAENPIDPIDPIEMEYLANYKR